MVREIEAQTIRLDDGARLVHVIAQDAAKRRVQQVRRGVIALRVASAVGRHARDRADRT
jgi:hypothetical protein